MTTKTFSNFLKRNIPFSAFCLTILAVVLMITEGFLWTYNQALFVLKFDAFGLLFHFGPGLMLTLCAFLLLRQPPHNKIIGFSIVIFALISIITGGGFLACSALGIVGGVLGLTWNSNTRLIRPINNRLMGLSRKNRALASLAVAALAVLAVIPTALSHQLYIYTIQQQTLFGSKLINTPHGLLEYADVGEGYPVLISHGGLMGYDQVESVRPILGNSFRLIVPSRFGYLRTPCRLILPLPHKLMPLRISLML